MKPTVNSQNLMIADENILEPLIMINKITRNMPVLFSEKSL